MQGQISSGQSRRERVKRVEAQIRELRRDMQESEDELGLGLGLGICRNRRMNTHGLIEASTLTLTLNLTLIGG